MPQPQILLLLLTLAMLAGCGDETSTGSGGPANTTASSTAATGGNGTGGATGGHGGPAGSGGIGGAGASGSGGIGGTAGSGGIGGAGAGGSGGLPSVTGVLQDELGQPIAGADVLCCSLTTCYFDTTKASGGFFFSFDTALPVDFVLKSLEDADTTPRRAATMVPLRFIDTTLINAGPLFVPSLPTGAVLGPKSSDPQTLDVGDGLQLVVRRADLTPPLGGFLDNLAARKIPLERVPPLPDLGAEEVIAVYALYPFATTSKSPIAIQAPSGLPAGTPVHFRSMSEYNGNLSAPAIGEADGTQVKTAALAGIDELTWLVISK